LQNLATLPTEINEIQAEKEVLAEELDTLAQRCIDQDMIGRELQARNEL
jgi:hypothetical protein